VHGVSPITSHSTSKKHLLSESQRLTTQHRQFLGKVQAPGPGATGAAIADREIPTGRPEVRALRRAAVDDFAARRLARAGLPELAPGLLQSRILREVLAAVGEG